MRYSSFSIFLNFILVFFIVAGSVYIYKKQKTEETRILKNYIAKKDIKFSDLSKKEQRNYLYIGSPDEYDPDVADSSDENTSQRYIQELKNKLVVVQEDNLRLSDEKDKISKLLADMKLELIKQKKLLLAQNIEQMDETEQQHYKNISELRKRINDLQRENIDLLQNDNERIISLQNEIKILKQKLKGKQK
ncbi:MAG: hypothetical protein R3331_01685 [Sulfurospirillaceae bacterium]|nr:hypothetical protein [Sulfurospirillaceae bacterium]